MSDFFGRRSERPQASSPNRRRRVLVPTLVTLAALLILGSVFTSVWTDRLWFRALGFGSVFSTILSTRIVLFIVFGLLFALVVIGNLVIAYKVRPASVPFRRDDPAARYRAALGPILKPAAVGLGIVLAAFAGSVASGKWQDYQLWRHGTDFGKDDPQFGKDIGFYVFDYPWLSFLVSYVFTLIVVSVIVVAFMHYVFGAIAFSGRSLKFSRASQAHLSILIGLGILVRAGTYWLDKLDTAVNGSGYTAGAGYTDVHARIPSKNILIAVTIVCAILFFAGVATRSWLIPGIGLGLLVLSAIIIGGIWPALLQSFTVDPSEPDKEGPYIARNIEATRAAYGLSDVEKVDYSAKTDLSPKELNESAESRVSSRLLDPTMVSEAFQQLQQVRGYYTVPKALAVDRYTIGDDKIPSDIVIAARELDLDGLKESQRNWNNDHTVYTHGYGVIAARGNERGEQGEPVWVEKDIPPVGDFDLDRKPRIYYGQQSPEYSIVGAPKGSDPIEVDIPHGGKGSDDATEGDATQNTYDGKGGVPVGSVFRKFLYAFKFGEPNIVLSSRVNSESKILYDRNPRERVEKVAPWLTVDGNPYPAVVDGKVVWILDGYTTSNRYPYSEHESLDTATSDSLTRNQDRAALPSDEINYIRNSVKIVVDSYDGTVDLYQWDAKDPVLKTWMKIFPDIVKPKSKISDELMEHLRYPQDLFKVQRTILTTYHVTNAGTFYEGGEAWKIPEDPAVEGSSLQPPYYLSAAPGGQTKPVFSLTSVFVPISRQNLASYISVNAEATSDDYGQIQILQLPSETQVGGPSQIANRFQSDKGVTQALLPFKQAGTNILYGNLLTLPVGEGLLYVQPVYIQRQAEEGAYPVLQFVISSFGEDVGYGQTLEESLRASLGLTSSNAGDTEDLPGGGSGGEESGGDSGDETQGDQDNGGDEGGGDKGGGAQSADELIDEAAKEYDAAQKALDDGDLASYQKHINKMGDYIDRARKASGK